MFLPLQGRQAGHQVEQLGPNFQCMLISWPGALCATACCRTALLHPSHIILALQCPWTASLHPKSRSLQAWEENKEG